MEIYYLQGKNIEGPYSIEELLKKNISPSVLIWYNKMDEWKRLRDVPEVYHYFLKAASSDLVNKDAKKSPASAIQPSTHRAEPPPVPRKRINWLTIWFGFNLLALILSYARVPFFNNTGDPRPEKFWPFLKFTNAFYTRLQPPPNETWGTLIKFNGIFTNYDWTEFAAYVGGTLFIILLTRLHNK